MKNILTSLTFFIGTICVSANSISNQYSTSVSRFGHLANSCIENGRLSGSESLAEIEIQIASHFDLEYYSVCSYLLEGFGYFYEVIDSSDNSDFRLIAFSSPRSGPTAQRDKINDSKPDEDRYVLIFDKKNRQFVGTFYTKVNFENRIAERMIDINKSNAFDFPELKKQKARANVGVSHAEGDAPKTNGEYTSRSDSLNSNPKNVQIGHKKILNTRMAWIVGLTVILIFVVVKVCKNSQR